MQRQYGLPINEAIEILAAYFHTTPDIYSEPKQPGGAYVGITTIIQDLHGNKFVLVRLVPDTVLLVMLYADGFVSSTVIEVQP